MRSMDDALRACSPAAREVLADKLRNGYRSADFLIQTLGEAGFTIVPTKPTRPILDAIKDAIWRNTWGDSALCGHWADILASASERGEGA